MARQIHYELYTRYGRTGTWSLFDALPDRAEALKAAETLLAEGKATAVRVAKETYQEATGRFSSIVIFEGGAAGPQGRAVKAETVEDTATCFKPDDFYSVHARATLMQLLGETLARWKLTVIELIHRADMLEKLEATGTLYQHAVQKVAVARAADGGESVVQIVRKLNELCERAMARVYKDERAGRLRPAPPTGILDFAAACAREADGDYLLRAGLAKALAPHAGWAAKLAAVLAYVPEAAGRDEAAAVSVMTAIDDLVAEIVSGGAAINELLGPRDTLGAALVAMAELFAGKEPPPPATPGLAALARAFAENTLPAARTAIASRILAELKGQRRLAPESLDAEVAMLRALAFRLVLGQSNLMTGADIGAAVTIRSKRLVTSEAVEEFIGAGRDPAERIERLLQLEENVLGGENKRRLAGFLAPLLAAYPTEAHFLDARTGLRARLDRLAGLQRRVLRSGFQPREKSACAERLDALAVMVLEKQGGLAALMPKAAGAGARLAAAAELLQRSCVTEGRLSAAVRAYGLALLKDAAAVKAYLAGRPEEPPESALTGLRELFQPPAPAAASAA